MQSLTGQAPGCRDLPRRHLAEHVALAIGPNARRAMRCFRRDGRVMSIMLEVNRRLYLDQTTGQANERFAHVQGMLCMLAILADAPASLVRTTS
jgi:hypothetical protein